MKVTHYVLTDSEHSRELEASNRTVIDPNGKNPPTAETIPAVFQPVDRDSLTLEQREEAMVMAGLDKYVGGVAFGVMKKAWRGHAAGSFAIRHLNSSGYHVHVFDGVKAPAAEPIDPELAKLQADEEIARLEEARRVQRVKDGTDPVPPANDNKEPARAPAAGEPPAA